MAADALPLDIRHLVFEEAEDSRTNGVHHVANRLAREQVRMGDAARIVLLHRTAAGIDLAPQHWAAPVQPLRLDGPRLFGHVVQAAPGVCDALLDGTGPASIVHVHGGRRPSTTPAPSPAWPGHSDRPTVSATSSPRAPSAASGSRCRCCSATTRTTRSAPGTRPSRPRPGSR
jgi:hypothetical protein